MVRNVLALIGLVALLGGLAVWQFGFFSAKVQEVTTTIERETAVARADAMIRSARRRADDLSEKARTLRIDARTREIQAQRETEHLETTRKALDALAEAARAGGLPKPTAARVEDNSKTIQFAGRTLSAADVYSTLENWQIEWERGSRNQALTETMIQRVRTAAEQLEAKQRTMLASVNGVQAKLDELKMQRDLAKVERELAELGANVQGDFAGDLGAAMETLQREIDELQATTEVVGKAGKGTGLTPEDVLAARAADPSIRQRLDELWTRAADDAAPAKQAKRKR